MKAIVHLLPTTPWEDAIAFHSESVGVSGSKGKSARKSDMNASATPSILPNPFAETGPLPPHSEFDDILSGNDELCPGDAIRRPPASRRHVPRRRCWPTVRARWCRQARPSVVDSVAGESLRRQRNSAISTHCEDASLPVVLRNDREPRGKKLLSQLDPRSLRREPAPAPRRQGQLRCPAARRCSLRILQSSGVLIGSY